MLVSVRDAQDAAGAAAAGVDLIEVESGAVEAARSAFCGPLRLDGRGTAAGADLWSGAHARAADEVALEADTIASLPAGGLARRAEIVARLAVTSDPVEACRAVAARAHAVVLDSGAERLLDRLTIAELDGFAEACRAYGVTFGFQGGLEAPDVARLLLLDPDVLGFDEAVRAGHDRAAPFDPAALRLIRSLIPQNGTRMSPPEEAASVVDILFVRDFVVALSIGAYQAERSGPQRVRFNVEVEVARGPLPQRDMGDVFSYDVIVETIRVRTARAHVLFVETLAEEVAAALLTHAGIRSAKVRVEKLDIIDGAVGIEIQRRRET